MTNEHEQPIEFDLKKFADQFTNMLTLLEEELQVPSGFLRPLMEENDWSFIIKSHALIEAALTNQLSSVLDSRLTPVFEQLELSDTRTGKVAFAEALELLDSNQKRFLRKLSELRNMLVHDIKKVSFDLKAHLTALDGQQRESFIDAFTSFTSTDAGRQAWRKSTSDNPKLTIFIATIMILFHTVTKAVHARAERASSIDRVKLLDKFFSDSSGGNK